MKKLIVVLVLLLTPLPLFAQSGLGGGIYSNAAKRIAGLGAAALPATCSKGDVFVPPGAPVAIYLSSVGSPTNTWTIAGPGGVPTYPLLAPDGTPAAPSYSFTNSSTTGLFLFGAGQLGVSANTTIGWFSSTGYHAFGTIVEAFNDINGTSTDGVVLTTNGSATVGVQDFSPRLRFTGSGWKTDVTAGPQTVDWIIENQPVQDTANPSSNLVVSSQINAGGYTPRATFGSAGSLNLSGTLQTSNNVGIATTPNAGAQRPLDIAVNGTGNTIVDLSNQTTSGSAAYEVRTDTGFIRFLAFGSTNGNTTLGTSDAGYGMIDN